MTADRGHWPGDDEVPARPEAATPPPSRSFEEMLAHPHEQFDGRSELLASIAAYAAAPPASAGIQPPEAATPESLAREWDALRKTVSPTSRTAETLAYCAQEARERLAPAWADLAARLAEAQAEREQLQQAIRSPVAWLAGLACGMGKVTGADGADWEHWTSCIRQAAEELAGLLPENQEARDAALGLACDLGTLMRPLPPCCGPGDEAPDGR